MKDKIKVGQLWWDKDHKWTDGSDTLDMVHLVLSRDKDQGNGKDYWKTAVFMWVGDGSKGRYCGAHTREFLDKELQLMHLVDSISTLKSF